MFVCLLVCLEETQQHLVMDCYRAKEAWTKLKDIGITVNGSLKSVMYGIIDCNDHPTVIYSDKVVI